MSNIASSLAAQAARRGAATAVFADEGDLSWQDWADLSLRSSARFRALGIAAGSHAALLCTNRPAYLVAWLGLVNSGAVVVSLNSGLVGEGLRYGIRQSKASALIVERALYEKLRADLEPVLAGLTLIVFDGEDDLYAEARRHEPDPVLDADGSEPVSIIYTSGTTGPPKGVLNCHEAFLACGRETATLLDIVEADRIMVFLPLFHTNPQMYAVMTALETGCALVIRPKLSVSAFFDDARRFGATVFTYVGTVLAMLTSRIRDEVRDHPITRCIGGGCPKEVWGPVQERFGITPHELYGMTEVGGWVTGNRREAYRFGSVGKARPDVEVAVFDAQDRPVPPGTPGEIVVRPKEPDTILLGYWDNAQASWEASRNFWFHTGDAGQFDEDGYLYFLGRTKEIIRRGGENISPFEIETVLLDHPGIRDAAVVAVPDPIWGQEIKAVVVAEGELAPQAVRDFLDGRVPAYMLPRYVQLVSLIPRTETQKIQRKALQENESGVVDLVGRS
ncbi:AMP-binding protein [Enterovirga rhinocerotis]|uniref:Crotonobetaine/carnitine-CoA ligase n=1 Tax=Enterovirga rhinocerotis TaxID=1339210 RepID=A0A4R7BXP3_9HYPH|nr:AMP-binding protein [Enterovirga rhinocerotis]TDR90361.1 crotonobetaine/carnitine-CoA ligase [Enterovirga rhinocerotis]